MRVTFQMRLLPAAMRPLVSSDNAHIRASVLRQFASLGLDAVAAGVDLRTRCASLCGGGGDPVDGSVMVKLPNDSALATSLVQLEEQLATRRGLLFALLSIVGWEQSCGQGGAVGGMRSPPGRAQVLPVVTSPPPATSLRAAIANDAAAPVAPGAGRELSGTAADEHEQALEAVGERLLEDFDFGS